MADEATMTSPSSPTAELFRRAYQQVSLLQNIDRQIAVLVERRRDEAARLADVQRELDAEFQRAIEGPQEA